MTNRESTNKINNINHKFIAGGISGIVEVLCTHPIDLIKTKLQETSQKNKIIKNPINFFYNNYKLHGIQYMYQGFIPRIMGVVPMRLIFWGVQGNCNEYLQQYNISDTKRLILSGIIGGTAQTLVDNPIETIKIRQMTSVNKSYNISKNLSNNILFVGFGPTLVRNSLFAAIFNYTVNISQSENYGINFIKGAIGGFIASIITQPIDYIKTEKQRITNHQRTIRDIIVSDYKFLMTGTMHRGILGFLNMGIGITVYSFITKVFKNSDTISNVV